MFGVLRNFSFGALLVAPVACDTSEESSWRWGGESEPQSDGDSQGEPEGHGEPEAGEPVCDYHTQTRGGWATECSGNNPGCYRDKHFQVTFPNGLWIGDGVMSASLGSSSLVQSALSSNGPPRALLPVEVGTFDNGIGFNNTLVAQMIALTLNVKFSSRADFTAQGRVPFKELILVDDSPCRGMSVKQVLNAGNRVLGGDSDKSGLSAVEVNECATRINESFIDGEPCCRDMFAFPRPSSRPQTRLPLAAPVHPAG